MGFRSVRLRLFSGRLVTIPNAIVANETIENVSRRPFIRHDMTVSVTYDTAPARLQRGVEIIRQMLADRAEAFPPDKPGRVHFTEFDAASLNIAVSWWFTPPDWEPYLQFTHDFDMELLTRFNDEGIEFAFPTQTLYLKSDAAVEPTSTPRARKKKARKSGGK